jgi:ABC-type antimicrobial peptide transport system permease subunit
MAVVVLLVSAIGLYALMTAGSAAWRSEIGVRMAVGATRPQIVILVARRGLRALISGVFLGVLAALGTNRLLLSLYSIGGDLSPLHVLAALAVLVSAALPALLLPARRASLIDPLTLLRHE